MRKLLLIVISLVLAVPIFAANEQPATTDAVTEEVAAASETVESTESTQVSEEELLEATLAGLQEEVANLKSEIADVKNSLSSKLNVAWSGSANVEIKLDENGIDVSGGGTVKITWSPFSGSSAGVSFKWTADDFSEKGAYAQITSISYDGDLLSLSYAPAYTYKNYIVSHTTPGGTALVTVYRYADNVYTYAVEYDGDLYPVDASFLFKTNPATDSSATIEVYLPAKTEKIVDAVTISFKAFPDLSITLADVNNKETWHFKRPYDYKDKSFFDDLIAFSYSKDFGVVSPSVYFAYYKAGDEFEYLLDGNADLNLGIENLTISAGGLFGSNGAVGANGSLGYTLQLGTPTTIDLSVSMNYEENTSKLYFSKVKARMEGWKVNPSLSFSYKPESGAFSLSANAGFGVTVKKISKISMKAGGSLGLMEDSISLSLNLSADDVNSFDYHNKTTASLSASLKKLADLPVSIGFDYYMEKVSKKYAAFMDAYDSPIFYNGKKVEDDTTMSAYKLNVSYEIASGLSLNLFYGTYYVKYVGAELRGKTEYTFDPVNSELTKGGKYLIYNYSYYNPDYPKWWITISYQTKF